MQTSFIQVAQELDIVGLAWQPEIGDEVLVREKSEMISILVDPQGMSPNELRAFFIWLPSVEQMIMQVEARNAMLLHMGLEFEQNACLYKTVISAKGNNIEGAADNVRTAVGLALKNLIIEESTTGYH